MVRCEAGGFAFLPKGAFSAGVRALPGFALHRARFARAQPLAAGIAAAAAHLDGLGRPRAALAACELRLPAPLPFPEFHAFNEDYVALLHAHGFGGTPAPVARSNLALLAAPVAVPVLAAFTYAVPEAGAGGDLVVSGIPEIDGGKPFGGDDDSADGIADKARFVADALRHVVVSLGAEWAAVTAGQVYAARRPAGLRALGFGEVPMEWFAALPPVAGFRFEADVRRVQRELEA